MTSQSARLVRQAMIAATFVAAHTFGTAPAHAQVPSHGISRGEGLLPPDLMATTRFHDPQLANIVDRHLSWIESGYQSCDPDYARRLRNFDLYIQTAGIGRLADQEGTDPLAAGIEFDEAGIMFAQDMARLEALLAALPTALPEPCPPESAEDRVYLRAFGHLGTIDGFGIGNGGLGVRQDVTVVGGGIDLSFPVRNDRLTFTIRYLEGEARGPAGMAGVDTQPRTFVQPDGQTQFVPAGLNLTEIRQSSEYREFGAAMEWPFGRGPVPPEWTSGQPAIPGDTSVAPTLLLGYSHVSHLERLNGNYSGIGFGIEDERDADASRLHAGAAVDLQLAIADEIGAWLRAWANANLDIVDGEASYHTFQTGVFDETVSADLSRTAPTVSFGVEGALRFRIADGAAIEIGGSVRRLPVWGIELQDGAPARLGHDTHWHFGGSAGVEFRW